MFFSYAHKLLFVHPPKCGGSSIAQILARATGARENALDMEPELPKLCSVRLKHLPAKAIKELLRNDPLWDELYIFTTARNSWARFVSLYFHLREKVPKNFGGTPFHRQFVADAQRYGFRHWLDKYLGGPYCESLAFYVIGEGRKLLVDRIFPEPWNDDVRNALRSLGLNTPAQMPVLNRRRKSRKHYSDYYNTPLRRKVRKACAWEIERFGFTFDE